MSTHLQQANKSTTRMRRDLRSADARLHRAAIVQAHGAAKKVLCTAINCGVMAGLVSAHLEAQHEKRWGDTRELFRQINAHQRGAGCGL